MKDQTRKKRKVRGRDLVSSKRRADARRDQAHSNGPPLKRQRPNEFA